MTDEARLINANALKEKLINIANIMAKGMLFTNGGYKRYRRYKEKERRKKLKKKTQPKGANK